MGKEGPGLDALEEFMLRKVGIQLTRIDGAEENYERGDFVAPSGITIECKRQPIDPDHYRQNFVEVCETTRNPRHAGGFDQLSALLGFAGRPGPKVDLVWSPPRSSATYLLRDEPRLSVSIHTFATAALVSYVNPGKHIYLYRSGELLEMIRDAAAQRPMVRGAGNSNADTFAVFVPLADWRWRHDDFGWRFSGSGREIDALHGVREVLRTGPD